MPVSETTYLQLAEEDDETWELHCGRLWTKEPLAWEHSDTFSFLSFLLQSQLDRDAGKPWLPLNSTTTSTPIRAGGRGSSTAIAGTGGGGQAATGAS